MASCCVLGMSETAGAEIAQSSQSSTLVTHTNVRVDAVRQAPHHCGGKQYCHLGVPFLAFSFFCEGRLTPATETRILATPRLLVDLISALSWSHSLRRSSPGAPAGRCSRGGDGPRSGASPTSCQ